MENNSDKIQTLKNKTKPKVTVLRTAVNKVMYVWFKILTNLGIVHVGRPLIFVKTGQDYKGGPFNMSLPLEVRN